MATAWCLQKGLPRRDTGLARKNGALGDEVWYNYVYFLVEVAYILFQLLSIPVDKKTKHIKIALLNFYVIILKSYCAHKFAYLF
jgi:hypothetical protein